MSDPWARSLWYRDPVDGVDTIDLDPDFDGHLAVDLGGDELFEGVDTVVALPPEIEGDGAVVIGAAALVDGRLTFRVTGSGALVTFRFTGSGAIRSNDLTVRLRAREG